MLAGTVVIDASVALAVVLAEPATVHAREIVAASASGGVRLVAPQHWLFECANICWKYARRGLLLEVEAVAAFASIRDIGVALIDTSVLTEHAIALALMHKISTYDALYVATAQYVDGTFVTADHKLVDAVHRSSLDVRVRRIS